MASYKILQDIEAEDKLVWRLSLKQFIFAFIGCGLMFVGYMSISAFGHLFFFFIFLLLATPFIFLAAPLGHDQPNDVWLLAKLNFLFKPKTRLWVATGQRQGVIIVQQATSNDGRDNPDSRPSDPQSLHQEIQSISRILDSRGRSVLQESDLAASESVRSTDKEHESQQQTLDQRFHDLLSHHHHQYKAQVQSAVTKNSTDVELAKNQPQLPTSSPDTTEVLGIIPRLAEARDLKITALESIIKKRE